MYHAVATRTYHTHLPHVRALTDMSSATKVWLLMQLSDTVLLDVGLSSPVIQLCCMSVEQWSMCVHTVLVCFGWVNVWFLLHCGTFFNNLRAYNDVFQFASLGVTCDPICLLEGGLTQ